jgi:LysR family hydrogen peroxide-inducible transcriptional activator
MIKIRELEYLLAIAEHKHFGRAAKACFVSQPTLSAQLIKLESHLDLQLIERHRGNVMLTAAGQQLVDEANKVMHAVKAFEASANTLKNPLAGDFHLGLIPTLAPYLLPHIMAPLNRDLTDINFFLYEEKTHQLLEDLDNGRLDALILPWLPTMKKFEHYSLFEEPLLLAVQGEHQFAHRKRVSLDELKGQQLLTLEDGHCLRDQTVGYCFAAGAEEDDRFQATSLETLRYMVASRAGITLMPALSTNNKYGDNLCYIPFQNPAPSREIVLLIRPKYGRMDCVREIVSTVRKIMR